MSQHYPKSAGFKDRTVSKDNAAFNRAAFTRKQKLVLDLYRSGFIGTADEAAGKLAISPFSTRPRCTELVKMGLLERWRIDRSIPGRSAWVLRIAAAQKELLI